MRYTRLIMVSLKVTASPMNCPVTPCGRESAATFVIQFTASPMATPGWRSKYTVTDGKLSMWLTVTGARIVSVPEMESNGIRLERLYGGFGSEPPPVSVVTGYPPVRRASDWKLSAERLLSNDLYSCEASIMLQYCWKGVLMR